MPDLPPHVRLDTGLMGLLGLDVVVATRERVVVRMPVTAGHLQPFGYLHGGASVALAETAASVGGFLNAPEGAAAFGLEINANHLRPVRTGVLEAEATPLHVGRTTQVWQIEIRSEAGQLVCASRCTLAVVEVPQPPRVNADETA
jgi:1,4-dihydroxy-2-naphthoyl-CoA hydrolase